jgi:hypothetical protein
MVPQSTYLVSKPVTHLIAFTHLFEERLNLGRVGRERFTDFVFDLVYLCEVGPEE